MPNYACIFLDFVRGFGSYVKGLPKTKRYNSVAVMVSVRFRCICVTALTVKVGWSIVFNEGPKLKISKNIVFLSLKNDFCLSQQRKPSWNAAFYLVLIRLGVSSTQ